MATNQPTIVSVNQFQLYDKVAMEIENIFNPLIEQLIVRRDVHLTKLQAMKEAFVTKETTRKAAIEGLERVIQRMQEEGIKVTSNFKVQENAIRMYREEMEQHQTPTKLPQPFFSFPTLYHLQTQIVEFGVVGELDYSLKKRPVLAVGKKGNANNELDKARGIAIDESNQLIYIADRDNNLIQVVSFAGKFLKRFGQGILKLPWGIAVSENNVLVTDYGLHALIQFTKDYKLLRRTGTRGGGEGELDYPRGLCIDYNGDVYVAESSNNRVSVFSKDLKFLKHLCTQQLRYPCDVKVTPISVVVLDNSPNCIHFFSRSGDLLSSCVTQGRNGMVYNPWFFCFDTTGNILITDCGRNNIKILSTSGQLIHTIGKEGNGKGELYYPFGICISQSGDIFVASCNRNFCIQSF